MYLSSKTKYVEINTECPLVVRLPAEVIGLNKWSISLLNIDSREIVPVAQFVAQEVGEFVPRTVLNGEHPSGTAKLVVADSSTISVGMFVRIDNMVFKVLEVEPATHIITINGVLPRSLVDATQIKEVVYPDYLGVYRFEFVPVQLGNFIVSIIDGNGIVNPIEDDVSVLATLKSANGSGKVSSLNRTDL